MTPRTGAPVGESEAGAPGGGEPLVLVHGLGASSRVWDPVVGLLEGEREVVVLDMPGFGEAPPLPAEVEPTAANLAAALRRSCAERGIERPHVAGNSLGGWVGLEMGRAGWAASVTAISPAGLWRAPIGPRKNGVRAIARRLRPLVSAALRHPGRPAAGALHLRRPPRADPRRRRPRAGAGMDRRQRLRRRQPGDAHPRLRARRLPEDLPVTLAWGERDRLVAPPRPERRPASSRFLVLPGVGHTPMWDDPELIARTLLEGSRISSPA